MAELPDDLDTFHNETIVTGAVLALLHKGATPGLTSIDLGPIGNQIDITLAFMKSAYRLTIEMVRDG